jgi:hypothetical protein
MSGTPIAPVPDLDTIIADVERLVNEAHDFISRGKPPPGAIASEWVPLARKLERRLEHLGHALDEVPAVLWDIVQAGPEGAGDGLHQFPVAWRDYEAKRHAKVLDRLAQIKSTIAGLPKTPPPRIYHHGERSYSLGDNPPVVVTTEEHRVLRAFGTKKRALDTKEILEYVENPSRIMAQLDRKFPGAVRRPGRKGDGYYVRVEPA